jgi:hypothetical protein
VKRERGFSGNFVDDFEFKGASERIHSLASNHLLGGFRAALFFMEHAKPSRVREYAPFFVP